MAMTYKTMESTGDSLSLLGYGCMRFPRKNGGIDENRTKEQVLMAFEKGVNYFDTAYLYPGSEQVLGKILKEAGIRSQVHIATKLPHIMVKKSADIAGYFEKQLKHLQTDYVDYYLVHNVNSLADWQRLQKLGMEDFVTREKAAGRIRHFGFSFHGNLQSFRQLLDDYPWDFVQIQYNYLDENFQAGTEGLQYAAEKGLGVVVMEPLRGGTLGAKIPEPAKAIFNRCHPERSPAEWALRWLFSQPAVNVVLSGMNEESHIEENVRIASDVADYKFTEAEQRALTDVKTFFQEKIKVPCTGCAYCLPCPHGVDIPNCFAWYNNRSVHGGLFSIYQYTQATAGAATRKPARASQCKNCGKCVKHCPQQIDIPARLKDTAKEMEKPYLRVPFSLALRMMARK